MKNQDPVNNLDMLIGKKHQTIKCCALCKHGCISGGSHKETFWDCARISDYQNETCYVAGSDVCLLFDSAESE